MTTAGGRLKGPSGEGGSILVLDLGADDMGVFSLGKFHEHYT